MTKGYVWKITIGTQSLTTIKIAYDIVHEEQHIKIRGFAAIHKELIKEYIDYHRDCLWLEADCLIAQKTVY